MGCVSIEVTTATRVTDSTTSSSPSSTLSSSTTSAAATVEDVIHRFEGNMLLTVDDTGSEEIQKPQR